MATVINMDDVPTRGDRRRCRAVTRVARFLDEWAAARPDRVGEVLTGDIPVPGVDAPNTTATLAYLSGDVPVLAAEVIAGADLIGRRGDVAEAWFRAGARLIRVLDPFVGTVVAFRPDAHPVMFSGRQEVTAPDVLPGFRVPAADLFG